MIGISLLMPRCAVQQDVSVNVSEIPHEKMSTTLELRNGQENEEQEEEEEEEEEER